MVKKIMGHQVEMVDTRGGGSGTHNHQAGGGGGGSYCSGEDCSGLSGGNINDDGAEQINEWLGCIQNIN